MADQRRPARDPVGEAPPKSAEAEKPPETDWSSWSNLWQVPTIVASVLVIILGLFVAMQRAPANDFDGALDQVDILIARQEFEPAARQLNEVIEPNLDEALPPQKARFEATVADWIVLSQKAAGVDVAANNRRIIAHYTRAVDLGLTLEPERLERWADALLALGDTESARRLLADLETRASGIGAAADVRERRNRVLRRIVETSLHNPGDAASLEAMLAGYRSDPMLSPADELWAIARQAELRIESGSAQEAIDQLLVDMRRFEPRLESNPELNYGELFALLARAYYDLGNYSYAQFHVDQAMGLMADSDVARGPALVVMGRLSAASGHWPEAFDYFDQLVRNFGSTPSAAAGRLGRAEVFSILGDHERSLSDYQALREALAADGPRVGKMAERAARSLADRHDAALTMGRLDTALQYILLAETFFVAAAVPDDVIFRIASTSRQIAENTMREAAEPTEAIPAGGPATRYAANEHYRRAGDYYVRHARRLTGRPNQDEAWADSLWLAADSYDQGGWHDLAVTHFTEYVGGRSEADPRRIEALFRLAQAHHAESNFEAAVEVYEGVITEHPRSHVASQCLVPLARCLLALGRTPEAEQQLIQIVSGERNLTPEAADYRDALIELGTLRYDAAEYTRAIEQLDEAARRYPDDPRIGEIRFRLADSHRRRSSQIEAELAAPVVTPQERQRLERLRTDHLKAAMDLFAAISETESRGKRGITEQMLRNAFLYRADCAYELGMYPQAVTLYDDYAGRYARHHSSMTALIQIVNCYSNLGDANRARTAHRRAIARLNELPEDAFKATDALLDRAAWERWLKNMPVETQTASAGR